MFTAGEMATNSLDANALNCNSTTLSIRDFASVWKTSAVSLNLFFKGNENKCVKVGQVLTEVETC